LQAATYKPDGSTRETYWNFSGGAFGQYYVGALQSINIIAERENNSREYVRTNTALKDDFISGQALANAFDTNVRPIDKATFLASVNSGTITRKELEQIVNSFNLTRVPENTEENNLLIDLLYQKDSPLLLEEESQTFRRSTLSCSTGPAAIYRPHAEPAEAFPWQSVRF
jgi:hypothetical protein